ncbi:hypothetical protein MJ575_11125 [Klebsiella pneumoniae]|nr:hypothetical protein MJ575_11125 [Klebsiella pneumoniae]
MLLEQARLPQPLGEQAHKLAYQLAENCATRKPPAAAPAWQSLLQEFSSLRVKVKLMCLAEAPLRIPDKATRDAPIRDKISNGNWQSHIGPAHRCSSTPPPGGCCSPENWCRPITRPASPAPEPHHRQERRTADPRVDMAMRPMGEQFRHRGTIASAGQRPQAGRKGFRHSYDMLGEAALTAADAQAPICFLSAGDPCHRQSLQRPRHL